MARSWMVGTWGLVLTSLLVGCGPRIGDGSSDDDLVTSCRPGDDPVPCVGHDGGGCLTRPRGEASCVEGQWICDEEWTAPQVDPDECTVPPVEDCEGEPVLCTDQSTSGDCSDAINDAYAFCMGGQWECPPGFHDDEVNCTWPEYPEEPTPECSPGDTPSLDDECFDQGPGECADATQPASCEGGQWTCPPGWDFGGYGEDCTWPE